MVSLVVSACGGDTAATTTSITPTTTTAGNEEAGDLLVVGDWGSGTLPQGAVAGAMMRYAEDNDVAAILTTGDNFYSDDAEFLMEPFDWATDAGIPFWITWGNHDLESDARVAAIDEEFDNPPRWELYRWGLVDVVVLDSTQVDSEEQLGFLDESLAASGRPTIVAFHHPVYSCGSYGNSEAIIETWVSRFDDDVFLVLSGHEHNYQRFEESSVTYVVTGGGGATLTEIGSCPPGHPTPVSAESAHHFLTLERDDGVIVSVIDVAGEPIDGFEVPLP